MADCNWSTEPHTRHGGSIGRPDGEEAPAVPSAATRTSLHESLHADAPEAAAPAAAEPPTATVPAPVRPEVIVFRKDPDVDGVGYKAVLEAITSPMMFSWVRGAIRTTAFVSFPLFTLAMHPNTMFKLAFPQMLISAVMSTSCHRDSLGEHLGVYSWIMRGIAYMMLLGTIFETWGLVDHIGAWWGMIALSIFFAGLCTHLNVRRFLFLYIFVYLMEIRMAKKFFGGVKVGNAAWYAADLCIGFLFGVAAHMFPYPNLTKTRTDIIIGKLFEGMGKMVGTMQAFVLSPNAHAAVIFFNDSSPFARVEEILGVMPALLWFCNWEPLEFPLRNSIRRLKLALLRRIMALTYAAFSVGRFLVQLRREQADRIAMQDIRRRVWANAYGVHGGNEDDMEDFLNDGRDVLVGVMRAAGFDDEEIRKKRAERYALRANTSEYINAFGKALAQTITKIGSVESKPEWLLREVPFADLMEREAVWRRNSHVEVLQAVRRNAEIVARTRERKQRQAEAEGRATMDGGAGVYSRERGSDANVPYGQPTSPRYALSADDAATILEYDDVIDNAQVLIGLNELFFQLLMSMIAGELQTFAEMMENYKPAKSLPHRLWDHFIVEPWNGFWEELWNMVTLARPLDVRTLKDSIKMVCAFLSACAFNFEIWTPEGGEYFFGTTILLGLPVEEESLNIGVCRMAGNTLGCALGYLALHNTKNLSEVIGLTMSLVFVMQCCKHHPVYGQCFFYASIITMAGVATSLLPMELLVRVLASTYTICAYMLCCMFVFPINPIKICWGYRMKLSKVMSEIIDDVAAVARLTIEHDSDSDRNDDVEAGQPSMSNDVWALTAQNSAAQEMFSCMNVEVDMMKRMLAMCVKWSPLAARQPVLRGMQAFPDATSKHILETYQRLSANMRLLVFGIQLIHRPRSTRPYPALQRLLSGSIANFLDEFSGAVRVIFQDVVDSLQHSRAWSYPLALSNASHVMRLEVRLHMILYETYVLMSIPMIQGTFDFDANDLRMLTQNKQAAAGALQVRSDDHARSPGDHTHPADDGKRYCTNVSFADRVLGVRRDAAALGDDKSISSTELHHSFMLPNASLRPARQRTYQYHAPLHEDRMEPKALGVVGQDDVKGDMEHQLRRELREREQRSEHSRLNSPAELEGDAGEGHTRPGQHDADLADSARGPHPEVRPEKRESILQPEPRKEAPLPPYQGPGFSYREDELGLPVDTDIVALVSILSSCKSMIAELAAMVPSVNGVSAYQKQLHETTLALPLIDKLSASLKKVREANYSRYHYPAPPPRKRGPLNAQTDPWQDWAF